MLLDYKLKDGLQKIDLTNFLPIAEQIHKEKQALLQTNNQHNLTNVQRTKSDMGVFSDYPHYYSLTPEGQ